MSKGSRYERELVDRLEDAGYSAARIGASGAGTSRDLPDVIALSDDRALVIEAKYRRDGYLALSEAEIRSLIRFGAHRGVTPLVAFRRPREPWRLFETDALNERGNGYSITNAVYEKGRTIEEL